MKIALYIIAEKFSEIDEKCKRYASVFDEVVVISNNQSDKRTIKNISVIYKPFQDDFSALRNAALDEITSDWIFSLDSDEEASPELLKQIPQLMNNSEIDGYWIPRRTYIRHNKYLRYGLFYPDYQMRLFRNKKGFRYTGKVHEQLIIPQKKTSHVMGDIIHHPHHPKYTKFSDFKYLLPYMRIQAAEIMQKEYSEVQLVMKGITAGFSLFVNGFFRGKGFLDGWDGFRAHILLAASIGGAYLLASKRK